MKVLTSLQGLSVCNHKVPLLSSVGSSQFRALRNVLLYTAILLCLLYGFSAPSAVRAEDLPEAAPAELTRILEDPQFHPRNTSDSSMERWKRKIGTELMLWLKSISEMIPWPDFKVSKDTPLLGFFRTLGELFLSVLEAIRWVFSSVLHILLLLLAAYLLYRLYRFYESRKITLESSPAVQEAVEVDFEKLLSSRRYDEVLSEIRQALRGRWFDQYALSLSLTDWEVRRLLPPSEKQKALFDEIASAFEQRVFAGRSIEEDRIQRLYAAFRGSKTLSGS